MKASVCEEQLGAATVAYDALFAERELWAEQGRSLEASEAEVT